MERSLEGVQYEVRILYLGERCCMMAAIELRERCIDHSYRISEQSLKVLHEHHLLNGDGSVEQLVKNAVLVMFKQEFFDIHLI